MRSKSPLTLMEQLVMVLVFALAAALCLQIFVFADQISKRNEKIDRAVLVCQNAAETIKVSSLGDAAPLLGGTFSGDILTVCYDEDWLPTENETNYAYLLRAETIPSPVAGLGKARVWVTPSGKPEESLFELTVAWQEVSADE